MTPSKALKSLSHIIPQLESGDRLTRQEFERRYEAMPDLKKAELIEGVVYVGSPVRGQSHSNPHGHIVTWLGVYEAATAGVEMHDNATVRLDPDNEPQPDACLRIKVGGQSQISEDDYIEGAPELVVEVAASSVAIDLHEKKRVYRRNGVQEYLVWRVLDEQLDWFSLQNGEYFPVKPDSEGVIQSQVFPGLWLAVSALLDGEMASVLNVLQAGLNSSEHQYFVDRLKSE